MVTLSKKQNTLIQAKIGGATFLEGPTGAGKTTVGVNRLRHLLENGIPGDSILVIVPQRTLALPYYALLRQPDLAAGGQVTVLTLGGLARRMVDIFWPLIAEEARFHHPTQRPQFLSLESAQYYMAGLIEPLIENEGYFDTVTIDRNRLYSQLIDNLNKAAVVGFSYTELGERLKAAWTGDHAQERMYDDVQESVNRFRDFCLHHNLLDFSLQVELFTRWLWPLEVCNKHLTQQYRHLIVDNIEEDTPATHRIVWDWLSRCESALVIYDTDAGYRRFLGSDPDHAYAIKNGCQNQVVLDQSLVTTPDMQALGIELARSLNQPFAPAKKGDPRAAIDYRDYRYQPQMIDGIAAEINRLVNDQGIPPGEIVVIAPYLSDALRFSLKNRLDGYAVPTRSHRPSRPLREEAATQCLLTLAQIAHPEWGLRPTPYDVAYALLTAIDGIDLVRAQLLGQIVYRVKNNQPTLSSFSEIKNSMQERITFVIGERYERLYQWVTDYLNSERLELDHFLSLLFGEVLSQTGFSFHRNFDAAETTANLIDSAQRFRWVIEETGLITEGHTIAQEYVEMVQAGIIANQYIASWDLHHSEEAVLLAPAYTFLMSNRPVDYQFWLNIGSDGWWTRLYQPLTHPYVLSQQWNKERLWTDDDEVATRQDTLYRLLLGLTRRCRKQIILGFSELGEQGFEQRGQLIQVINRMLRHLAGLEESHV